MRAMTMSTEKYEGLEVVAWQDAENPLYTTAERRVLHDWANNGYPIVELCRLSDHQRAIAELREECERLRKAPCECGAPVGFVSGEKYHAEHERLRDCRAERDTLRQQLAERDATIERLEAGIPRLQEHAHQMRQQRDKLAGLLRMVRQDGWYHPLEEHEIAQIDAALDEVNK